MAPLIIITCVKANHNLINPKKLNSYHGNHHSINNHPIRKCNNNLNTFRVSQSVAIVISFPFVCNNIKAANAMERPFLLMSAAHTCRLFSKSRSLGCKK